MREERESMRDEQRALPETREEREDRELLDLWRDSSPAVRDAMARRRAETRGMSEEERLADLLAMRPDD